MDYLRREFCVRSDLRPRCNKYHRLTTVFKRRVTFSIPKNIIADLWNQFSINLLHKTRVVCLFSRTGKFTSRLFSKQNIHADNKPNILLFIVISGYLFVTMYVRRTHKKEDNCFKLVKFETISMA